MEILSVKNIDRFIYAVIHSLIAELDEGHYLARMYSDVAERKEASEALEQLTKNLEIEGLERTQELQVVQKGMQVLLISHAETRDNETGEHIMRTDELMKVLATSLSRMSKYSKYLTGIEIEML